MRLLLVGRYRNFSALQRGAKSLPAQGRRSYQMPPERDLLPLLRAGRASIDMLTFALAVDLFRKQTRMEVTGWRCNKVCAA